MASQILSPRHLNFLCYYRSRHSYNAVHDKMPMDIDGYLDHRMTMMRGVLRIHEQLNKTVLQSMINYTAWCALHVDCGIVVGRNRGWLLLIYKYYSAVMKTKQSAVTSFAHQNIVPACTPRCPSMSRTYFLDKKCNNAVTLLTWNKEALHAIARKL